MVWNRTRPRWILGLAFIGDLSNISIVSVRVIGYMLDTAVRKSHRVGSIHSAGTVTSLFCVEVSICVIISNSVFIGVGGDFVRIGLFMVGRGRVRSLWSIGRSRMGMGRGICRSGMGNLRGISRSRMGNFRGVCRCMNFRSMVGRGWSTIFSRRSRMVGWGWGAIFCRGMVGWGWMVGRRWGTIFCRRVVTQAQGEQGRDIEGCLQVIY